MTPSYVGIGRVRHGNLGEKCSNHGDRRALLNVSNKNSELRDDDMCRRDGLVVEFELPRSSTMDDLLGGLRKLVDYQNLRWFSMACRDRAYFFRFCLRSCHSWLYSRQRDFFSVFTSTYGALAGPDEFLRYYFDVQHCSF